jgi:hypothetical protein
MDQFVTRAKIDRCLDLLNDYNLSDEKRRAITKQLVEEENKLMSDLEQLEFVESRAARGRVRLSLIRRLCEGGKLPDPATAQQVLANIEAVQVLLEGFRDQLRARVNSRL